MNDVLKKQFEWYEANLESLLRDYRGKYIAFSTVDVQQDAVVCRAFWDTGAQANPYSVRESAYENLI